MVERDHRRVHARLHPPGVTLRVRDQLDGVTELARVTEVDGLDALNPLAIDLVGPDLDLVRDRREDGELVRRVIAADVFGRVSLSVACVLRLAPPVPHGQAGRGHPPAAVAGRAVAPRGQALAT